MRRLVGITLTLLAAAALAGFAFGSRAQGSSSSRFDVIFDDARGLIAGQLVKIAGAKAGTIENVVVTPDFKARIQATVESRFMPFHKDATCIIRPEGLIAENYVDCDPGSANSPPLAASKGLPPTVPVANTTEPVSLLDLFNIFNLPTRQRFMVIIDELGIGAAGRGADFNAILRRANPTLALARQVITLLNRQRGQLGTLLDATNTIAAQAATHTSSLQGFLDRAAAVTTLTAQHRSNLSLAMNRLPPLLAATQPALRSLDTVAVSGTPLLQQIHAAVPALNKVNRDLGPFVAAAKPSLAKVRAALEHAIPQIRDTTPLVTTIRRYVHRSLPGTALVGKLFTNLQRTGLPENLLSVFYYVAASLARFDATSHIVPAFLIDVNNGLCGNYATTPVPGCNAHYGGAPAYSPGAGGARRTARPRARGSAAPATTPSTRRTSPAPGIAAANQLRTILHGAVPAGGTALKQLQEILRGGAPTSQQTLQNLVAYLLK